MAKPSGGKLPKPKPAESQTTIGKGSAAATPGRKVGNPLDAPKGK